MNKKGNIKAAVLSDNHGKVWEVMANMAQVQYY